MLWDTCMHILISHNITLFKTNLFVHIEVHIEVELTWYWQIGCSSCIAFSSTSGKIGGWCSCWWGRWRTFWGSRAHFQTCVRGRCKHSKYESSFAIAIVFIAIYLHGQILNMYIFLCYSLVSQSRYWTEHANIIINNEKHFYVFLIFCTFSGYI